MEEGKDASLSLSGPASAHIEASNLHGHVVVSLQGVAEVDEEQRSTQSGLSIGHSAD